jgi:hypothetical protein
MKSQPNAYDAAYAAAGLMDRVNDGCSDYTLTRVTEAALAIAEVEAEGIIPEGCYDDLLDFVALQMRDRFWPGPGVRIETAVRDVLAGMKGIL